MRIIKQKILRVSSILAISALILSSMFYVHIMESRAIDSSTVVSACTDSGCFQERWVAHEVMSDLKDWDIGGKTELGSVARGNDSFYVYDPTNSAVDTSAPAQWTGSGDTFVSQWTVYGQTY